MTFLSQFEREVNTLVWKHEPSSTHNLLCSQSGCYSNCHQGCTLDFTLDPSALRDCSVMRGETCIKCSHSLWDHHHYRVLWKQVFETQTTIDEPMKKQWEEARASGEIAKLSLAKLVDRYKVLNDAVNNNRNELTDLVSDYAQVALGGSFSAQVEKAIKLLKQKLKGMRESGVDREQLAKVEESLKVMRKKYDLLAKLPKKSPRRK
jgi:hypothetical protein